MVDPSRVKTTDFGVNNATLKLGQLGRSKPAEIGGEPVKVWMTSRRFKLAEHPWFKLRKIFRRDKPKRPREGDYFRRRVVADHFSGGRHERLSGAGSSGRLDRWGHYAKQPKDAGAAAAIKVKLYELATDANIEG